MARFINFKNLPIDELKKEVASLEAEWELVKANGHGDLDEVASLCDIGNAILRKRNAGVDYSRPTIYTGHLNMDMWP